MMRYKTFVRLYTIDMTLNQGLSKPKNGFNEREHSRLTSCTRKRLKLSLSVIWNFIWSSDRVYRLCRMSSLNKMTLSNVGLPTLLQFSGLLKRTATMGAKMFQSIEASSFTRGV